jgi:predicted HicB family RNase H-like nuclease
MPQTTKQPDLKFNLRLPHDLGEQVWRCAEQEERSANSLIKRAIRQYVGRSDSTSAEPDPTPVSRDWIRP